MSEDRGEPSSSLVVLADTSTSLLQPPRGLAVDEVANEVVDGFDAFLARWIGEQVLLELLLGGVDRLTKLVCDEDLCYVEHLFDDLLPCLDIL